MKTLLKIWVVAFAASCFFLSSSAFAGRGKDIFEAADRKDDGYKSSDWTQELILTNALGKENRRVMRVTSLEGSKAQGDKTLIVFR